MKNPAVLEKPAYNTDDANVFAEIGNFRTQTTDTADDQIDSHIRAGSFIKLLDDLLIDQRVQLRDNAGRFARPRVVTLAFNQSEEAAMQLERWDHQFFQAGITGQTGKRVETARHSLGQFRFAR